MNNIEKKLLILLSFIPFINIYPYAPYGAWIPETSALIISAVLICFLDFNRENKNNYTVGIVQFILTGLLLSVVLSYIVNKPSYLSITIISVFYLFCGIALSGAIYARRNNQSEIFESVSYGLLIGAVVQMVFAVLQGIGAVDAYSAFASQFPLYIPQFSPQHTINGFLFQRNLFADYLFMASISACYLYAEGKIKNSVWMSFIVASALFIAVSMSRSAIVYILFSAAVLVFAAKKNSALYKFTKAMAVFLVIAVAFQLLMPILSKLISAYIPALAEGSGLGRLQGGLSEVRWIEWKKAWMIFIQHPWFGTGMGTYAANSVLLKGAVPYGEAIHAGSGTLFTHCHNLFLQFLAETGLLGGGIAILGSGFVFYNLIRTEINIHKLFALLCLSVLFIHSQLEFPLWYASFFMLFVCFSSTVEMNIFSFNRDKSYAKLFMIFVVLMCLFGLYSNLKIVQANVRINSDNDGYRLSLFDLSINPLVADVADFYLVMTMGLNEDDLEYKLFLTKKLIDFRPHPMALFRYGIFLIYDDKVAEGEAVIVEVLKQNPSLFNEFNNQYLSAESRDKLLVIDKLFIKKSNVK